MFPFVPEGIPEILHKGLEKSYSTGRYLQDTLIYSLFKITDLGTITCSSFYLWDPAYLTKTSWLQYAAIVPLIHSPECLMPWHLTSLMWKENPFPATITYSAELGRYSSSTASTSLLTLCPSNNNKRLKAQKYGHFSPYRLHYLILCRCKVAPKPFLWNT